jgi:uncharacterized protein (TIGR02466 family)
MNTIKTSYNFYNFGPKLVQTNVSKEDLNAIKKLISKKNKFFNPHNLAGVIEHEHVIDVSKYAKIIAPYFQTFVEVHKEYKISKMKIVEAWINYMTAGEYNPVHVHDNCNLSSVLFIKVPKGLKEENDKLKKLKPNVAGPGVLSFMYGEMASFNCINRNFFPEEGQLFIFTNVLRHCVYPFTCKGERISIAANAILEE